jgi:hypothetical protein
MAKLKSIKYRRSIIPANDSPERVVQKYEAEDFQVELEAEKGESMEDLFLIAEVTVLNAHAKLQDRREARADSDHLQYELDEIAEKLDCAEESMYDVKKLKARAAEIEKLLRSL